MNLGTGNDKFMRDHINWHSKAKNWAMFQNISVLGMIHQGNHVGAYSILDPYLPNKNVRSTDTDSEYINGGALYALGLIYSNFYNKNTID